MTNTWDRKRQKPEVGHCKTLFVIHNNVPTQSCHLSLEASACYEGNQIQNTYSGTPVGQKYLPSATHRFALVGVTPRNQACLYNDIFEAETHSEANPINLPLHKANSELDRRSRWTSWNESKLPHQWRPAKRIQASLAWVTLKWHRGQRHRKGRRGRED